MRGAFLCAWLLVPAVVAAYHYGPGQERLLLDDAAAQLQIAERHAGEERWPEAVESYDAALALIPNENIGASRRVRLERAKARMLASQLPEAYNELTDLAAEVAPDGDAPRDLIEETRGALASAQYYLTWLMRLEGRPRSDWEPEIEASRQNYRLLAEQTDASDDPHSPAYREDLESAIRLARMDLADLQALPLPKQCNCCNSGKCRGRGVTDKEKQGKSDARGASSGPPPDNRGS